MHEKNSSIHLDRLQNKHRNCKENKYDPILDKIQEYRKKFVATYKQNASY